MNRQNIDAPSNSTRIITDPNDPRYVPRPTPPPAEWQELQDAVRTGTAYAITPGFAIAALPGGFAGNIPAVANTQFHQWLFENTPVPGNHVAIALPAPPRFLQMPPPPRQVMLPPAPQLQPPAPLAGPARPPTMPNGTRIQDSTNYGEILKGRPPQNARPPNSIDISMVEICTFFPSWFIVPRVILRAVRNGFTRGQIVDLQLEPIGRTGQADRTTAENRLQKQVSKGGQIEEDSNARWDTASYVRRVGLQHDLTANNWMQRDEYKPGAASQDWVDVELAGVAAAVPQIGWPAGDDRLLLTRCLEYAAANPALLLTTAHWGWIIQNQFSGVVLPIAPPGPNANRDTAAVRRVFG